MDKGSFEVVANVTLNSIDQIVHAIDKNFNIYFINERGKKELEKLGLKSEIVGQNIKKLFQFLPPKVWEEYEQVFKTGETLITKEDFEIEGKKYVSETQKIPIKENNKIIYVITIIKDITSQVVISKENLKLEQDYKQIFNNFPNGSILTYDMEFRYLLAGGPSLEEGGLTNDVLIGNRFYDIFSEDVCKVIEPAYINSLKGEETTLEVEFRGRWYRTINIPNRNDKGEIIGGMVMNQDITREKKAVKSLLDEQKRFQSLLESTQIIAWELDLSTNNFTYISPQVEELTGYKVTEWTNFDFWRSILHDEDREEAVNYCIFETQKGRDHSLEYRIVNKDKTIKWLNDIVYVVKVGGKPTFLRGFFIDITEQKEKNRLLKESEEKFKKAFYTSPDSVNLNRLDGTYVEINQGFTKLSGYTAEEVIGRSSKDINIWTIPEDRERLIDGLKEKGIVENLESEFLLKGGEIRTGLMSAAIINIKGENHIISITRDISESKKIRKELEKSEWKYRVTFESIKEGLWDWDLLNDKGTYSPSSYKLLGYQPDEFENNNESWMRLIHPDDIDIFNRAIINHLSGKSSEFLVDCRIKNKKGNWHWVKLKGKIVEYTDDGKPKRILGAIDDIDEIKRYESDILNQNAILKEKNIQIEEMLENLQRAKEKAEESDRLKTLFLNNMSHEIRTPMNGILGFLDFLDDPETTKERRTYFARIIRNSSKQLMKIVDDILEISSLETKQVKVNNSAVCLNDVLIELFTVFDMHAKEKEIPLYLKNNLTKDESTILTDKPKLLKIMSNLLENAIKFTSKGFVEFGSSIDNDELKIYVKDTGIGISEQNKKLVFERFAQADKEASIKAGGGLGIGLSIAKENAELLGGRIEFESEIGKGAVFTLILPHEQTESTKKEFKIKNDAKYKILVAEDEEINYLFLQTLLNKIFDENCEILHAKNGIEAIDISEKAYLDLVLMDIKMPMMDGCEAAKKIKKNFPSLPIIAQTAYSTPEDREHAIFSGCDDFITKPIDKEHLKCIMVKFLVKDE